ncbi:MAG: hypothetical protein FWC56_05710, partial [Phycisphaerae bacterium]|nr:hypothetical protein [Phycisphaerae bacterium]
ELADLEEDQSHVVNGQRKGATISQLVAEWGRNLLGSAELVEGRFPLLIKFLDAADSLSVQVHPTEAVARRLGGNVRVKHEAWYILTANPGSYIYHGLELGVTAAAFRQAMLTGQIDGILRRVPVRAGECYYLPSGTAHALGAGVLVAEVQTPSDITYRTYDFGRIDPSTGQPRTLHLDQAMENIDFDSPSPPPMQERQHVASIGTTITRLATCPSFTIERVQMSEGVCRDIPAEQMNVWIVLDGSGSITWQDGEPSQNGESLQNNGPLALHKGNVVLIPAGLSGAKVAITQDFSALCCSIQE